MCPPRHVISCMEVVESEVTVHKFSDSDVGTDTSGYVKRDHVYFQTRYTYGWKHYALFYSCQRSDRSLLVLVSTIITDHCASNLPDVHQKEQISHQRSLISCSKSRIARQTSHTFSRLSRQPINLNIILHPSVLDIKPIHLTNRYQIASLSKWKSPHMSPASSVWRWLR